MRNAALLLMVSILATPVAAMEAQSGSQTGAAAQPSAAPAQSKPAPTPSDEALPVSVDRIRKALTVESKTATPDAPIFAAEKPETPHFATQVTTNTMKLRWYLDDGTAVPAYVRAPFDPVHYEFLEMITPDAVKGCNQFVSSDNVCAGVYAQRVASGLVWQQLFSTAAERGIKSLFSR